MGLGTDLCADLRNAQSTGDWSCLLRSTAAWSFLLHLMFAICLVLLFPYMLHDTARSSYERYIEVKTDPSTMTFFEGLRRFFVGDLGAQTEPPPPSFLFDHFNFLILSIIFFVADVLFLFLFRPQDLHLVAKTLNEPIDKEAFERHRREVEIEKAAHKIKLANAEADSKEHKARAREADLKGKPQATQSRNRDDKSDQALAIEKKRQKKLAEVAASSLLPEKKERLSEQIDEEADKQLRRLYVD